MTAYQTNTLGNDGNISSICSCGNVSEYHSVFLLSIEAVCSLPGNTGNEIFDVRLKEAFYYADVGGSKNDLFGRIASYLKYKKEKSRAICFSLIEPVFIVVAGGFILIILLSFFMPLINGIGVL